MHPDHRVMVLQEAIDRTVRAPEQTLWARRASWGVEIGLGESVPEPVLFTVQARQGGGLRLTLTAETPDQQKKLWEYFPECAAEEAATEPVTVLTGDIPTPGAGKRLEAVLDRVYGLDDGWDLIWYGLQGRPLTPLPVYPSGCLSVLFLLAVMILLTGVRFLLDRLA